MPNPNTPVFPYAASTDSNLAVASDNAQTTLNGDIGSSDTAINVASTTAFNTPCIFVVGNELILALSSTGGNEFTGCVRGFAGSTAASHLDTAPVYGYIVAYLHNQAAAEINAMSSLVFNSDFSGLKTNQNLLLWSEAFETGSSWTLSSGSTITVTNLTSPIDDLTGRTLLEGSTLGINAVASAFSSPTIGATYTFSVYAKYNNNQWLTIGQDIPDDTTRMASFDIENGVLGTIGAEAKAAIVSVGGGWYRCLVTTTCTSNSDKQFFIAIANGNNSISYLGTTTQAVNLWGAQVQEEGFTQPLTYIATDGAIVNFIGGGDLILDEGPI
jgi:hypothetical protein